MSVEIKAPFPGGGDRPPVSRQRHAVLQHLRGRPRPVTAAALAEECGLHVNTVREHLDALVDSGLAVRERGAAAGRGRPAWRYLSRPPQQSAVREYAGLAAVLAGQIARSSADPEAEARAAGEEWGRALVAGQEPPGNTAQARGRIIALLDEIGFAPETEGEGGSAGGGGGETESAGDGRGELRVRLPHCPFIEIAREHPGVICGVHAGLVRAGYAALGGAPDEVSLRPFAEPGACRLSFVPAGSRDQDRKPEQGPEQGPEQRPDQRPDQGPDRRLP
ncbi:helix-turn-helix transcriptional regulator [Streptomyces sp. H51]|uniref:helix-turn-helix transcriptional regulator n=1 Tax=Streptomyces sp. H51 TaxID=3111770 RepID=UPI002D787C4E|nr:helix-turn-helix domain-containing protein [Streptomyces sp. H51]